MESASAPRNRAGGAVSAPGSPRPKMARADGRRDGMMAGMSFPETRPAAAPARTAAREPDWDSAVAECRRILADLIAIDTSNPPGRELDAVRFIEALLAREGIRGRTFESAAGRGNFVARLPGSGAKRPLLLLGHVDVVGVEPGAWASDP